MTAQQYNDAQLAIFNARMKEYLALSRKTTAEAVSRKGNDVRIQLMRGFKSKRWGGKGKLKGLAIREFKARQKRESKRGIVLREGLAIEKAPTTSKTGKPLTSHQRLVWEELRLRQKGIGVLGASVLLRRWDAKKTHLRENVTGARGKKMSRIYFSSTPWMDKAAYNLDDEQAGALKVSDRYRLLGDAIGKVSADVEKYLKRKHEEAMRKTIAR